MDIYMSVHRCGWNDDAVFRLQQNIRLSVQEMTLAEALEMVNEMFWREIYDGMEIQSLSDDHVAISHERYFGAIPPTWGDSRGYGAYYHSLTPGSSRKANDQFAKFVYAVTAYAVAWDELCSDRVKQFLIERGDILT